MRRDHLLLAGLAGVLMPFLVRPLPLDEEAAGTRLLVEANAGMTRKTKKRALEIWIYPPFVYDENRVQVKCLSPGLVFWEVGEGHMA